MRRDLPQCSSWRWPEGCAPGTPSATKGAVRSAEMVLVASAGPFCHRMNAHTGTAGRGQRGAGDQARRVERQGALLLAALMLALLLLVLLASARPWSRENRCEERGSEGRCCVDHGVSPSTDRVGTIGVIAGSLAPRAGCARALRRNGSLSQVPQVIALSPNPQRCKPRFDTPPTTSAKAPVGNVRRSRYSSAGNRVQRPPWMW